MSQEIKEIIKGSIVSFDNGHYRVTRVTKKTVNLGTIFGKHIYHKGIPLSEVKEDEDNWYKGWSKSDTYRSM